MPDSTTQSKIYNNTLAQLKINIKQLDNNQQSIRLMLNNIAFQYGYNSQEYVEALELVYKVIPSKEIRQTYIAPYMSLPSSYSHVAKQIEYMRFKQHLSAIDCNISPWNNNKKTDQEFAQSLDIPTPQLIQSECKFENIEFTESIVIKPSFDSSSRNVFFYFNSENIVEVKTNDTFTSLEAFKAEIARRKIQGSWQTETLILNRDGKAAHDIKVYAYYGEIGAVLEIKRADKAYQCWYNEKGDILESERRSQPWFEGTGFESQVIEYAKKISLNIPAPFMRIDFYKGVDGYYLGELTPHPGRYFPEYSPELDKQLGQLFSEAEARLFQDLLKGSIFSNYLRFYQV
ncbi:ATP-grasp fold amidoligase family protein [Psychrobacter sp. JB385]|uniref:ATP-grasp fold amidoligase family protein n=1 Tax=Psychrobacter sp. JB385 TaxID=1434841 RepID=UPI00097F5312|nr:ATP-grasp fold amidoligase family protein [Psychrobacter sp. JB385]SJN42975.1 teichuronopeptide biosynthesis [Psychrobacter sp. JB385]